MHISPYRVRPDRRRDLRLRDQTIGRIGLAFVVGAVAIAAVGFGSPSESTSGGGGPVAGAVGVSRIAGPPVGVEVGIDSTGTICRDVNGNVEAILVNGVWVRQ